MSSILKYGSFFILLVSFLSFSAFSADEKKEIVKNSEKSVDVNKDSKDDKSKQEKPKVSTTTFDDWALECYEPAVNGIACQMIQRIVHDELKQNILLISIAYQPKKKKDIIQFVLPLDFSLMPGVLVEIGKYKEVLSVNRCAAEGCYIEGGINSNFAKALKTATDKGRFVIVARDGQKVAIPFSAKGFNKAYEKMKSSNGK